MAKSNKVRWLHEASREHKPTNAHTRVVLDKRAAAAEAAADAEIEEANLPDPDHDWRAGHEPERGRHD